MDLRKLVGSIAVITLLFVPPAVSAATLGELPAGSGTYLSRGPGPLSLFNFSRPALAGGTLTSATVVWTGGPVAGCTDAYKIKFLRTNPIGLLVVTSRGPFNAVPGLNTVTLSPPVTILQGDFIGITQLRDFSCGGVSFAQSDSTWAYGGYDGDPSSGNVSGLRVANGLAMSARATSEAAPIHGYLPVVGSTQGGFGALFKTAAQLVNLGGVTISGRLVFHRAGTVGTDADPAVSYTLQPLQTVSIGDVVAATGTTGLGSMDLIPNVGYPPDITTRIYDDKGTEGTAGFTEDLQRAEEAFYPFNTGVLTVPADLTNFRFNVGVRTLGDGATIFMTLFPASGLGRLASVTKSYPPNWFEQVTVSQFLGGATVPVNTLLHVYVSAGSLFFYGATTDNRTNDGSIRFPTKY